MLPSPPGIVVKGWVLFDLLMQTPSVLQEDSAIKCCSILGELESEAHFYPMHEVLYDGAVSAFYKKIPAEGQLTVKVLLDGIRYLHFFFIDSD